MWLQTAIAASRTLWIRRFFFSLISYWIFSFIFLTFNLCQLPLVFSLAFYFSRFDVTYFNLTLHFWYCPWPWLAWLCSWLPFPLIFSYFLLRSVFLCFLLRQLPFSLLTWRHIMFLSCLSKYYREGALSCKFNYHSIFEKEMFEYLFIWSVYVCQFLTFRHGQH